MYDRWSKHYQGPMEVLLSLHDLDSASATTKNGSIQKRITELKAYIHYLKLYYDYQKDASLSNYEKLINYIYGIHYLRLLQTSALLSRYITKPKNFTGFKNTKSTSLTYDEIESNFKKTGGKSPSV